MEGAAEERKVFALDVGTRTVVGLVAALTQRGLVIKASRVEEHRERAMLDGQIHDIPSVSRVVAGIRAKLEKSTGCRLQQVVVAAAGRSLQTVTASFGEELSWANTVRQEDVFRLEAGAIAVALESVKQRQGSWGAEYYCVGYSVLGYKLDGHRMANLLGQRGRLVETEVIATFLPRVVIDSLYAVLNTAGLAVQALTLEPIAAAQVAIPPAMRQLNIALVDVGAGTSDIALTRGGSLVAYGMVPVAGDEITEEICDQLLVEFSEGERVKRKLAEGGIVEFINILGQVCSWASGDILRVVEGRTVDLADQVAGKILELNGRAPQAVILVGGGSLIPGLARHLSASLGLPADRVAVRGSEVLPGLRGKVRGLAGPQLVTPVGIAMAGLSSPGALLSYVTVNGRPVCYLTGRKGRVIDALLAGGARPEVIYGRPGKGIAVEINDELKFVRGGVPVPAQVKVGGKPADLLEEISAGDRIDILPAVNGPDASLLLKDLLPEPVRLVWRGREIAIPASAAINGREAPPTQEVPDQSKVTCHLPGSIADVLEQIKNGKEDLGFSGFLPELPDANYFLQLNGEPAYPDRQVSPGDTIHIIAEEEEVVSVVSDHEIPAPMPAALKDPAGRKRWKEDGEWDSEQMAGPGVRGKEPPGEGFAVTVFLQEQPRLILLKPQAIMADVLAALEQELQPETGRRMEIKVNGAAATFVTPLMEGDTVSLTWV